MKCKECKDTMCKHRSINAEQDCVLSLDYLSNEPSMEKIQSIGLFFIDNKIYSVENQFSLDKGFHQVKEDVTEKVLDCLLRVLKKQESAARQEAIVEQLMKK